MQESEGLSVVEYEYGKILRLRTGAIYAMDSAVELLGILEAELDAEVEDTGWKSGHGIGVGSPILIQLESLGVELTTDGNEISLKRVSGSQHEFDDLRAFIREREHRA